MLLKNITISGLGGVGGYYGAMLVEAARREGLDRKISFVARGAHRAAIEERGLHVRTPERDFTVRPDYLAEDPHDLPPTDLLILATKSYDLEANIQQLRPIITPTTIILPLLNGADITDQIQALLPEARVWDGCVYISGRKPAAGEILLEAEREIFLFGSRGAERSAEERELFALLESVGVHVVNPDNIEESIRKKFLMISATATGTSYYNMTVGEALASHPVEMRGLIEELCTLFSALGHDLGEGAVERTVERQTFMIPSSTSSMHVDFMAGSSTELENLTGYVVRAARRIGLELPLYERMYKALATEPYPPKHD
ncbi:ketopantoate reductase family protein [Porphyromonas sp.]